MKLPLAHLGSFVVIAPQMSFWTQFGALIALNSLINSLFALVVYYFVALRPGTTTAFLVSYGLVIPIVLLLPFHLIRCLEIENTAFVFIVGTTQILSFLRCLEAYHGTLPLFALMSYKTFVLYFVAPTHFNYDPITQKVALAEESEIRRKYWLIAVASVKCVLVYSLLIPLNYTPFPSRRSHGFSDLFYWGNICNNYVAACLTIVCAEGGSLAVGVTVSLLTGCSTLHIFDKPLSKSLSPSEFWGRRWNLLVGGLLKRGVYKPLRNNHFSEISAGVATFIISGLVHEYILALFSVRVVNPRSKPHSIKFGNHFLFFAWNGAVLALEHLTRGTTVVIWMSKRLPKPLITALVLLTVLPVAHWFTDEIRDTNFYTDYAKGFPRIVKL